MFFSERVSHMRLAQLKNNRYKIPILFRENIRANKR